MKMRIKNIATAFSSWMKRCNLSALSLLICLMLLFASCVFAESTKAEFVPRPKKPYWSFALAAEAGGSLVFAQKVQATNGYIKNAFPLPAPNGGLLLQFTFKNMQLESGYCYHTGSYAYKVKGVENQSEIRRRELSNALVYNRIPLRFFPTSKMSIKKIQFSPFVGTSFYFSKNADGILRYNQDNELAAEGDFSGVTSSFSTLQKNKFLTVNLGARFGIKKGKHGCNLIVDYNWNNSQWQVTQALYSGSNASGYNPTDIAAVKTKVNALGVSVQYCFRFYEAKLFQRK